MAFAEVSVNSPIPARESYTYEVPAGLAVQPGHGVYVPFGPRVLQGIVVGLSDVSAVEDTRPLLSLIDAEPLVSPERLELSRWIADRYLSPLYPAISLMLPPGFERRPLTILEPGPRWDERTGSLEQEAVTDLVAARGRVELDDLKRTLGLKRTSVVNSLVDRGVLSRAYELDRPRVRARLVTYVELKIDPEEAAERAQAAGSKRSRQADVLDLLADGGAVPLPEARAAAGGMAALNRIVSSGAARLDESVLRLEITPRESRLRAAELRMSAAVRQEHAVLAYLARAGTHVPYPTLREDTRASRITLEGMERRGLVTLHDVPSERDPLAGQRFERSPKPVLSVEQESCVAAVVAALGSGGGFLLHGVTGSGKTEVYLKTLEEVVKAGRQGIVLVPEIALTPQTIRRFGERFPGKVAVLHSGLSAGELYDQWHGIRAGKFDVVVGARGATFAPLPNLGMIILDEEHEFTYKQSDRQPRYDARAVASRLALLTGSVVVAGSATPRVESFHAAEEGRVRLMTLNQRLSVVAPGRPPRPIPLPSVELVDLREELRAGNRSVFSRALRAAISEALSRSEQVILFLNRRGSSGFMLCRGCGFVPRCNSCGLAFSYHRNEQKLVCHGCNRRRGPYERCPSCRSPYLRPMGAGTQRIEEEAGKVFPAARLLRWDRDVTQGKGAHERILTRFLNREADILIGTQMLAKGLDLPGVTLVGVVNADIGLNLPDFRAAERTFQLLTQVAGRAGRAGSPGRVLIQTYMPDHYAIVAAAEHDYSQFFEREIEHRRKLRYPPFRRLLRLTYAHTSEEAALREADRLASELRTDTRRRGLSGIEVVGPSPAYAARVRGRYRWDVLVKGNEPADLLEEITLGQNWIVDVDPVALT
ncbi:MAG TPA: primosomal protein N' [Dehalococcoidia bacterium]|nr:primosomal protein N' [Dehalococcoidia bacterium]